MCYGKYFSVEARQFALKRSSYVGGAVRRGVSILAVSRGCVCVGVCELCSVRLRQLALQRCVCLGGDVCRGVCREKYFGVGSKQLPLQKSVCVGCVSILELGHGCVCVGVCDHVGHV